MKKLQINLIIDLLTLISAIITFISGFILWFVVPKGSRTNLFLGILRGSWINIHNYAGLIFVILIIIHLILHRYFIKNFPRLMKTTKR